MPGQQQPLLGVDGLPGTDPEEETALQHELTEGLQEQEQEQPKQGSSSGGDGDKFYVPCELVHIDGGTPAAISLQLKNAAKTDGIRLRKSGILIGNVTGEAMHQYVSEAHGWKSYIVCSTSAQSSLALILEPGSKRVRPPEGVQQKMLDEELAGAVRKMLASTGPIWTTLKLAPPKLQALSRQPTVTRDDLIAIMKGYMHLNPAEWQAELWALTHKPAHALTACEKLVLQKPIMANKLREALLQLEGAKAFVKFMADAKRLQFSQFEGLDKLLAVKINPDGSRSSLPCLAADMGLMDEATFILLGDAGLGKSVLARAMCALYCEAHGTPYYIESNTPDSLRTVYVNGFFRSRVPVHLDEWKPMGENFTGRDGIDMLKCLTTVGDGATIKCRYSDIRFMEDMPRIQSCNVADLKEWCDGLGDVPAQDLNAVLRRCVFVEVKEQIVPKALQKEFLGKRRESCYDKMAAAAAQQGMHVPAKEDVQFKPMVLCPSGWKPSPL